MLQSKPSILNYEYEHVYVQEPSSLDLAIQPYDAVVVRNAE